MLPFYFAVALTSFRRQLSYRWANIAGLFTNIFFSVIFSYLILALYRVRPVTAGYDLHDTLTYTWLIQSMIMVVLPFNWLEVMLSIRTGDVISDLSKPCDFYWYWFSREIGRDCYFFLFRSIPIYVAGMVLFSISFPTNPRVWCEFVLVFLMGATLGIAYRFLYNVIAFWVIEARAFAVLGNVIGLFCTGSYVPIPFFPAWLRSGLVWSPFNGLMNFPTEVLLNKLSAGDFWLGLSSLMLWLLFLTLLARLITRVASRRVTIQGG